MIRDFAHADEEDFIRLCKLFYSSDAVLHDVPDENFRRTFAEVMAGSPLVRGLIIEHEGKRAGYALLGFTHSNEVGGLVVLIEEAYILPEFQGLGLGGGLLDAVEEEYADSAERLRLEITKTNARARSLYERKGYRALDYLSMTKDFRARTADGLIP